MNNMNLNAGGIIGGLLGAALGVAALMAMDDGEGVRRRGKLVVLGVVCGAVAGNFLWGLVFGRKTEVEAETEQLEDA